jgi:hypothetical protein
MKQVIAGSVISLGCVLFIFSLSACKTTGAGIHLGWASEPKIVHPTGTKKVAKGGPPPHAPAHGYRAKYTYRYYPSSCIYFDACRKLYFYLEGDNWTASVSLPSDIQLQLGSYVTLEMDTDKPYTQFEAHKRKYPAVQLKKKTKKWAKY